VPDSQLTVKRRSRIPSMIAATTLAGLVGWFAVDVYRGGGLDLPGVYIPGLSLKPDVPRACQDGAIRRATRDLVKEQVQFENRIKVTVDHVEVYAPVTIDEDYFRVDGVLNLSAQGPVGSDPVHRSGEFTCYASVRGSRVSVKINQRMH